MRLKIEYRATGSLVPYANNARTHSDAQIDQIAASIDRFGFVNPVLVGDGHTIIAGHGRVLAAKQLGMDQVPVIKLAGLTEAQQRALALADNRIALNSGWDEDLLKKEILSLMDAGEQVDNLGFDDKELQDLFAEEDGIQVVEVPTGEVEDRFWISIRGPLRDQAEVLQRLQKAMDDLDEVDVDLGTVAVDI